MDDLFMGSPGDTAELWRRDGVIWYGLHPPSHSMLTPLKRVQGD